MEPSLISKRLLDYMEQYEDIASQNKKKLMEGTIEVFGKFIYGFHVPNSWHLKDIKRDDKQKIIFFWTSSTEQATCPECGADSHKRVKTYKPRHIQDLPLAGMTVYHMIKSNRYYCNNPDCDSITFVEQFYGIVEKDARLSDRLKDYIIRNSIESSANASSRTLREIGIKVSTDTILRLIKKKGATVVEENLKRDDVNSLAVDDINLRKGNSSTACSVFIDAETHRVLAIVQGGSSKIAGKVIEQYPSAALVSRDRSSAYSAAATKFNKVQVADGFHLVQNIHQVVKDVLYQEVAHDLFVREGDGWVSMVDSACEKPAGNIPVQYSNDCLVVIKPATLAPDDVDKRVHLAGLNVRQAVKYRKTLSVLELAESGLRTREIAKRLSIGNQDVWNFRRNAPEIIGNVVEKYPEKGNEGAVTEKYGILKTNDGGTNWNWAVKIDDICESQNRTTGWPERDYGASWGDLKGEDQISPKGRFAWGIGASPVVPDICYTTDFSTIFRTLDGGCTWKHVSTRGLNDGSFTTTGVDVISSSGMFFDPFDSKHIAAVFFDCGIFHSYNKGESWLHAIEGVPREWINSCYWMVFDPDIKGKAWSAWSSVHNIPRVRALNIESHMKNLRGGICRAENGIEKWTVSSGGIPEKSIPVHIVIDPESPPGNRTLYAAVFYSGIYKSEDDGRTWVLKNNGIGDNRNVWRLVTAPGGAVYLLVSRGLEEGKWVDGALYKSTDGGSSWVDTGLPGDMGSPNDLVIEPECPHRMYLACWPGTHGVERKGGLFVTEDSGETWKNIFNPEGRVFAAALLTDNSSTVFITTFESGVYRSDDRGENWRQLKGFDFQWCHRPLPDPDNNDMIYLTTHGSSIWYPEFPKIITCPGAQL